MTAFTFDTSGAVGPVFDARTNLLYRHLVRFPDLSPFMQGYVTRAMASLLPATECDGCPGENPDNSDGPACCRRGIAFHMIAPATLAAMMADCEKITSSEWYSKANPDLQSRAEAGAEFWRERQRGRWGDFPPLTLTIREDGLVYQEVRS